MRFVNIQVVDLYCSSDTVPAWNKSRFIESEQFDFHIIYHLLIAVNNFAVLKSVMIYNIF